MFAVKDGLFLTHDHRFPRQDLGIEIESASERLYPRPQLNRKKISKKNDRLFLLRLRKTSIICDLDGFLDLGPASF